MGHGPTSPLAGTLESMLNLEQQETLSKARARLDAIRGHL